MSSFEPERLSVCMNPGLRHVASDPHLRAHVLTLDFAAFDRVEHAKPSSSRPLPFDKNAVNKGSARPQGLTVPDLGY